MKKQVAASLLVLSTLAPQCALAEGETHLTGEISADVGLYDFSNQITGDSRPIDVHRSLATQHLEFQLSGPLAKSHFAEYTLRSRLAGTYFQVTSNDEQSSDYINPELTALFGSLTLFPTRSYPLRVYGGKTTTYSIRYEANNRSDLDVQKPQLAVVRSYGHESKFWGTQWKHAVSEPLNVGFEYKNEEAEILRRYDFDENLDIYADLSTLRVDPTSPTHDVDIINNIDDDTVSIFVDLLLLDTLPPGASGSYVLDAGEHEVEFVPTRRRPYRTRVDIQGDMTWRIIFNDPSGPNDLRQSRSSGNAAVNYEETGKIKNKFYTEVTDSDENIQGIKSGLNIIQNDFAYEFSENAGVGVLSSYSGTTTDIQDISSQTNKMFLHQTTGRWAQPEGWSTNLMHSYTWASAENPSTNLQTNTHMVNAQVMKPSQRLNHRLSARANATLLSDSNDFKSDQYTVDVGNSIEVRRWGFRWRPRNQTRYSLNMQSNPGATTSEWEVRDYIEGQHTRVKYLGELNLKGEFSWRRREDDVGFDAKNRYLAEVGFARRFGQKYRISATVTRERETFSASEPPEGSGTPGQQSGRPDEDRSSYRFDAQLAPWPAVNLGVNTMLIQQNDSSIQRSGISLISRVPKLNIPFRSFVVAETRKLELVPEQRRLELETKFSYNFRAVRLTFSHSFIAERLIREDYRFHEVRADLTRSFNIF